MSIFIILLCPQILYVYFFLITIKKGIRRTGFYAGRIFTVRTMIAFNRPVAVLISHNDAERTNHDA
jgi:hypothetical protein